MEQIRILRGNTLWPPEKYFHPLEFFKIIPCFLWRLFWRSIRAYIEQGNKIRKVPFFFDPISFFSFLFPLPFFYFFFLPPTLPSKFLPVLIFSNVPPPKGGGGSKGQNIYPWDPLQATIYQILVFSLGRGPTRP